MSQILLDKKALELRMNMGWRKARRLLAKMGVMPIDVGEGQSKRLRWLEAAVDAALLSMHEKAQPKAKKQRLKSETSSLKLSLAEMSASSVYELLAQDNLVQ